MSNYWCDGWASWKKARQVLKYWVSRQDYRILCITNLKKSFTNWPPSARSSVNSVWGEGTAAFRTILLNPPIPSSKPLPSSLYAYLARSIISLIFSSLSWNTVLFVV